MTLASFADHGYQAHNAARLEHLASLGLPLENCRVLEVGCGPGDHTVFYVERNCEIVSVDARVECIEELKRRHPKVTTRVADLNCAGALSGLGLFDVVHAYGILYHLSSPSIALEMIAEVCSGILVLETCVSKTDSPGINLIGEGAHDFSQAQSGMGCRPARAWVFAELQKHFPHVYQTRTQPRHNEFPTDWTVTSPHALTRVVLVASRQPLDEVRFSPALLNHQTRW